MSSPSNMVNFLDVDLSPFMGSSLNQSNSTLFNSNPNLSLNDGSASNIDFSYDLLLEPDPVPKLKAKTDQMSYSAKPTSQITHQSVVNQLKSHLNRASQDSTYQIVFTPEINNSIHLDDFNLATPTSEPILISDASNSSLNLCNLPSSSTMNYIQTPHPQGQPGIISRSNSQPDLANTVNLTYYNYYYNTNSSNSFNQTCINNQKLKRYPSLTFITSPPAEQEFSNFNINDFLSNSTQNTYQYANSGHAQNASYSSTTSGVSSSSSLTTTSQDDGLFLGVDAITDFLSKNSVNTDFLDDLPDLEDLMSLVTFETSSCISSSSALTNSSAQSAPPGGLKSIAQPLMPNLFEYTDLNSLIIDENLNLSTLDEVDLERTTRSAPPSPTQQRKKQRPTTNLPWNKAWNKMDDDERSKTVKALTRIINDEMGLREQLEIIRILNPDIKLKPTDTQFIIDLKMIDDEKFKRIKDVIKVYGISLTEKSVVESPDCPLAKRELRIKRAQQRLKLKQKKELRQVLKENKSGLFCKTQVIPLRSVLPEEDTDIDILG
ncbi:hypothetical protein BpHYR1_019538 [Brachionus plicatilis]|uniref:Uncharacterized protein n=1 Tax=Brachionus plicatilis TaxID=10195 RepID=A0A3M7R9C8_BRAPC|nr:hypothetical protein BpHYR1_019538 [Brachionus plicatilis]